MLSDRSTLEVFSLQSLTFHNTNIEEYDALARRISALKAALGSLDDYYTELEVRPRAFVPSATDRRRQTRSTTLRSTQGSPSSDVFRVYPHPTEFSRHESGERLSFTYEAEMDERSLLFKGKAMDNKRICIKFVRRYGKDVHLWFARRGSAPELIAFETLPGGWYMVVMELLDTSWILLADMERRPQELKRRIHVDLVELHQQKMVHGDLRDTNIMVREGLEFMVLDFDWAGGLGEVMYPPFINKARELGRPADVDDGVLISAQHDLYMLEKMFKDV